MPDGEQEPVSVGPVGVLWLKPELVAVGDGENISDSQGLADVTLSLHLAHVEGSPPDALSCFLDPLNALRIDRRRGTCIDSGDHLGSLRQSDAQWMCDPPLMSYVAPVM